MATRVQDGTYAANGGFVFDYERISRETGWPLEEIRNRGVSWCRRNPAPACV